MAITYTWTISTVERTIATGGINTIHWRCTGVDGDHSCANYGTVGCTPDPSASDFIAYGNVTEANCIAWAQGELDKTAIEENIAVGIGNQKTPTSASGQPWSA
mgnify:CR=1 FL=1